MRLDGRERLVVGVDVRCLRAGLDRLAGVGVHAREVVARLLAGAAAEGFRIVPFAGSRWRSRAGEALCPGERPPSDLRTSLLPGRALEALWRRFSRPLLEAFVGPSDLLHGPDHFLPPHSCPRRIYTVHDLCVLRRPQFATGGFRRYFERELGSWRRPGTSFIAVSAFTRDELVGLLGVSPERVRVVPNGVGPGFRPPGGSPLERERLAAFRAARELPERFFLGVGSIQPRKNLLNLLHAVRILGDRGSRPEPLVLCGNQEWLSGPIREEARALGGLVRFLTLPRAEMPLLYGSALALVFPSFYEGFGLPLLEAMACGTPVAASRAGAHPEVLGEAGIYFPPEDPGAMAACLERLREDECLRSRLSAAGRARAATFTWDKAAAETLDAYRWALGVGRTPPVEGLSATAQPVLEGMRSADKKRAQPQGPP